MTVHRLRDFGLGAFSSVAPENLIDGAAAGLTDMMIDDEGTVRRRGGSSYKSSGPGAGSTGMLAVWDGYVVAGRRTLLVSDAGLGVLGADDTTDTYYLTGQDPLYRRPPTFSSINGMTILWGGYAWAGSRKTTFWTPLAGETITLTQGSKAVVRAAGSRSFVTGAEQGTLLVPAGSTEVHVVDSVTDATHLTLRDAWEGATVTATYYMGPFMGITGNPGSGGGRLEGPLSFGTDVLLPDGSLIGAVCVVGDKLLAASTSSSRVYVSAGRNPATGALRPWSFSATDYHELPSDARILGMRGLRDRAFVFTAAGVFVISNVAFGIVDASGNPQRRVEHYTRDVVLTGDGAGIVGFRDALVVPASDDIYLLDGLAEPQPITLAVRKAWRTYVKGGWVPGGAVVFRGHYVMPLFLESNPGGSITWLLRLDRPRETPAGVVFPQTGWSGMAGKASGFAVRRASATAEFLWAAPRQSFRLLDVTAGFDSGPTTAVDADGSNVVGMILTRDLVGAGLRTVWRRVRLRYKLGAGGAASVSIGRGGDAADLAFTAVGVAPARALAEDPFTCDTRLMGEMARVLVSVTGGDEFVLHSIEVEARDPGRSR